MKRRDEMPLHTVLAGSWGEAFARDSDLVWKAREEHYKMNCSHFDCETSHKCFLGHDHIHQSTVFPNLQDLGVLGRAEKVVIC